MEMEARDGVGDFRLGGDVSHDGVSGSIFVASMVGWGQGGRTWRQMVHSEDGILDRAKKASLGDVDCGSWMMPWTVPDRDRPARSRRGLLAVEELLLLCLVVKEW